MKSIKQKVSSCTQKKFGSSVNGMKRKGYDEARSTSRMDLNTIRPRMAFVTAWRGYNYYQMDGHDRCEVSPTESEGILLNALLIFLKKKQSG
jgi:hypothetical protein